MLPGRDAFHSVLLRQHDSGLEVLDLLETSQGPSPARSSLAWGQFVKKAKKNYADAIEEAKDARVFSPRILLKHSMIISITTVLISTQVHSNECQLSRESGARLVLIDFF